MRGKNLVSVLGYALILAAGLSVGWAAPRIYDRMKPAFNEADYSYYFANTATNVVVYGTPTCPFCAKTREYLRQHHIKFADRDITNNAKNKSDFERLGSRTVPVVLVGRRRINGYNESALKDALEAAATPVRN